MRALVFLLCVTGPAAAQVDLAFAPDGPGEWAWNQDAVYSAATTGDCRTPDATCAVLRRELRGDGSDYGYVMRTFDAAELRGRDVRFRAWLRVEAVGGAGLFVRIDRPTGIGFQKYALYPGVRSRDWTLEEVAGRIDEDAVKVTIGVMFRGTGTAWMAEPELETVSGD